MFKVTSNNLKSTPILRRHTSRVLWCASEFNSSMDSRGWYDASNICHL